MVGCVLVREGRLIGEGFHAAVGGRHAEPAALADCGERGNDSRGATAYVTLEPCCHVNKRTPPCVPALVEAGIKRVVVGCLDPNPAVNGGGVRQLREAGVEVEVGVCEREAKQLLAPFRVRMLHGRPFVTVKWAQDAEGRIAGSGGVRRQISGPESMGVVHRLRGRCGAVVAGGETVRRDDPMLTARGGVEGRKPLRVVITGGEGLDLPAGAKLFHSPGEGEVLVYTSRDVMSRVKVGLGEGVRLVGAGERHVDLGEVMADLYKRGVWEVLVESGGRLAGALLQSGLADRLWVFASPRSLGEDGPKAVEVDVVKGAEVRLGDDTLTESWNPKSPVFLGAEASADVVEIRGELPKKGR